MFGRVKFSRGTFLYQPCLHLVAILVNPSPAAVVKSILVNKTLAKVSAQSTYLLNLEIFDFTMFHKSKWTLLDLFWCRFSLKISRLQLFLVFNASCGTYIPFATTKYYKKVLSCGKVLLSSFSCPFKVSENVFYTFPFHF